MRAFSLRSKIELSLPAKEADAQISVITAI
jgi:hypothetical protein